MPAKRTRGAASKSTEETRQREHIGARHHRYGTDGNGNGGRLFDRARRGISEADLPDLIGIIQNRATRIYRDGEMEARKIASQISLMGQMIKSRWDEHRDLPWRTVTAFTVAIIYFVGPFDVVPDFIPVIGFLLTCQARNPPIIGISIPQTTARMRSVMGEIPKYLRIKLVIT